MKSLSGIWLGISLVFGCLLLALVLELYYMLIWKKRITGFQRQQVEIAGANADEDEDKLSSGSSSAREFLYMFCCKKVSSLSSCAALNPHQICASVRTKQQLRSSSSRKDDVGVKSEDGFLLCQTGPPRYLFTITEETMKDLESDEADDNCTGSGDKPVKSRRTGSTCLNELLLHSVDEIHTTTPYLTPLSSPSFIIHDYSSSSRSPHHGFNPFLESSSDVEFSKIKASPPPKFSFLQAAEEKFNRKKMLEEEQADVGLGHTNKAPSFTQDSFITIVIGVHSTDKAQ